MVLFREMARVRLKIMPVTVLMSLLQGVVAAEQQNEESVLYRGVGQMILAQDAILSYQAEGIGWTNARSIDELAEVYRSDVDELSKAKRVEFLWAGLWHLTLQGGPDWRLHKIIVEECSCGPEIAQRLETYLESVKEGDGIERHYRRSDMALSILRKHMEKQ